MLTEAIIAYAATAQSELNWFSTIDSARGRISFNDDASQPPIKTILSPNVSNDTSPFATLVRQFDMNPAERFLLLLSLIPYLQPELPDILLMKNEATGHLLLNRVVKKEPMVLF